VKALRWRDPFLGQGTYLLILGLGLLCGLAFWYRLGSTGLLDETEPLFAESARQMTVTGNWITPYFNGLPRYDKPPLIYWLMAIAYKIGGVNEWSVRIPSAIAASLLVFFVAYVSYWWVDRSQQPQSCDPAHQAGQPASDRTDVTKEAEFSELGKFQETERVESAEFASASEFVPAADRLEKAEFTPAPFPAIRLIPILPAAALILNLQMIFFARTGYSDMLLNFCFGGSLLSFFLGYSQPDRPKLQRRWYLAFWILMGLGVLTKGPVGVVLPSAIAIFFVLLTGQGRSILREMPWRGGLGSFLGIALPWYGLAYLHKGSDFINSFFGFHNIERFTQVVNQHGGPWYYHFLMVLAGFAPWSLALPVAIGSVIWDGIEKPPWQVRDRHQQLGLFALIWFVGVLGFFTIAQTKYITYSLPAIPAAALLVGLWWGRQAGIKRELASAKRDRAARWAIAPLPNGLQAELPAELQTELPPELPSVGSRLRWENVGRWLTVGLTILLSLALAIAARYSPMWLDDDPSMPNLTLRVWAMSLPQIGLGIWLGAAIGGLLLVLLRRSHYLWQLNLVAFSLFVLLFMIPSLTAIDAERQLPLRQIASATVKFRQAGEPLVMAVNTFEKPSLVFYTQQTFEFINRASRIPPYLAAKRKQRQSVLMVTTDDTLTEAKIQRDRYQVLAEAGVYELVRFPKDKKK
jgi:4-amino-4-deoxy-L-arabinose transferase-like glycosyltransferase